MDLVTSFIDVPTYLPVTDALILNEIDTCFVTMHGIKEKKPG